MKLPNLKRAEHGQIPNILPHPHLLQTTAHYNRFTCRRWSYQKPNYTSGTTEVAKVVGSDVIVDDVEELDDCDDDDVLDELSTPSLIDWLAFWANGAMQSMPFCMVLLGLVRHMQPVKL